MKKLKVCRITNLVYAAILALAGVCGLIGYSEYLVTLFLVLSAGEEMADALILLFFYLIPIIATVVGVILLVKAIKKLNDVDSLAQLIHDRKPKKVVNGAQVPVIVALLGIALVVMPLIEVDESLAFFGYAFVVLYLASIVCSIVFHFVRKTCVAIYEHDLVKQEKEVK